MKGILINRRDFFKIAGGATLAASAGYIAGKSYIRAFKTQERFLVSGFIPADEQIIGRIVRLFKNTVRKLSFIEVGGAGEAKEILKLAAVKNGIHIVEKVRYVTDENYAKLELKPLQMPVKADILLGDNSSFIFDPDTEFPHDFAQLRNEIRNKEADFIFSAFSMRGSEQVEKTCDESLKLTAVIEADNSVIEKVPISGKEKNISVRGAMGDTSIRITESIVSVTSSPCRNRLCMHTLASNYGDIIACAPNRVMIRIEKA